MIPKMDYIVVTRHNWGYLPTVINSILKQTNLNKLTVLVDFDVNADYNQYMKMNELRKRYSKVDWGMLSFVYAGHFKNKCFGAYIAKTDYIVLVDDDVELKDNWIEEMWPYMGDNISITGVVSVNGRHEKRMRELDLPKKVVIGARLQNAIVKRKYLSGFIKKGTAKRVYGYGVDAGLYFGHFLDKMGKRQVLVPVFSRHAKPYKSHGFRDGLRGGSRRRLMGKLSYKGLIKYIITNTFGGLKMMFKYKHSWYLKHSSEMSIGMLIGFFRWQEYYKKLDY